MTDQPQAGGKQPTPGGAADNAEPAAKTPTKKSEPKVSDAVQKVGKALLKSNPDMSVVYMTADGRGFYEKTTRTTMPARSTTRRYARKEIAECRVSI